MTANTIPACPLCEGGIARQAGRAICDNIDCPYVVDIALHALLSQLRVDKDEAFRALRAIKIMIEEELKAK